MVQDEIESMKMVKIQLDTKEIEFERYIYQCLQLFAIAKVHTVRKNREKLCFIES